MQLKLHLTILLIVSFFCIGKAQSNLKIGHVNIQEIVPKLPVTDSIQQVLKIEADEMEKMYGEMLAEHDSKVKAFEKDQAGYSDFTRKTKENEIVEMTQKIQVYNQTAQQQLQKRNMELLQPIYEKVNAAIKSVADRDSYTYILEIGTGAVAYMSPDSKEITPLVLKELGIEMQ